MQTPEFNAGHEAGAAGGAVKPGGPAASASRISWRRVLLWSGGIASMVLLVAASALAALIYFNIESNPIVGRFVRDRIVVSLQERVDPSLRLEIGSVDLKREATATLVRIADFAVRAPDGRVLVSAPAGTVTLASASLALLRIVPLDVQLEGLNVAVDVDANGAIAVGRGEPAAAPAAPSTETEPPIEQLRQMIGSGFAGFAAMRDAVGGRLPQVGVSGAAVTVRDLKTGKTYALTGISSTMESLPDGAARGRVEVKMREAAFAISIEVAPHEGGRQRFAARTENLQVSDILAVAGLKPGIVETAAPISATVTAEVDKDGKAHAASAGIAFGKMRVLPGSPAETFTLDELSASLSWVEGDKAISLTRGAISVAGTSLVLTGDLTPPASVDAPWGLSLTGKDQKLAGAAKDDRPVEIASARAAMQLFPATRRLVLEQATLAGPRLAVEAQGEFILDETSRPGLKLSVKAQNTDVRAALRLWPVQSVPDVRTHLIDTLRAGQLNSLSLMLDMPPDIFALAWADKPIPDSSVAVSWNVGRGVFLALKGLPAIREASATGSATGRTVRLDVPSGTIDLAGGRKVALSDGQFLVADSSKHPTDARVKLRFSAQADALAELLRSPALQAYAPRAIDPQTVKGQGEGEVLVQMRLGAGPSNDARVSLNGQLRNISIEKVIGNDRLEAGNFQISSERDITTLKGDARVFGTPAQVEVRGSARGQSMATLTLTMDDAARARKGIALGQVLTGPVNIRFSAPVGDGPEKDTTVEMDLARAAVAELVPGWTKRAGAPAKGKARLLATDSGYLLDRLELDAGTLSLRGSLNVGADGAFQKAALTSFRLSPGDNVKLDAERTGGLTRITVSGNAFDARPFLRSLQTGAIDRSGARDTEVNLKTTVLSGFGGELIANADLKMGLRGTDLRRFDMTGRFDQGPVVAKVQAGAGQSTVLSVETEDAGAFLRFFDIYSRMRGGDMILNMQLSSGAQSGTVFVKDFALRNEPAMKRLVADVSSQSSSDSTRIAPEVARRLASTSDVSFTKMTATFARTAGRLDVKDAVMWGPDIGGSLSGTMDYARDRVDLTGTFVPAYTINNFFSQVPLFGPLLGGGRNEGLFAVRYNIVGRVSAPTLQINPLTAIAPGFLRKLIDFRGAGGTAPSAVPRHEQ